MVSKHKGRSPGFRDRSEPNITIDGREEGYVSFAQKRIYGPGGAADDVTPTSQQGCWGSTDRLCRRKPGGGRQDRRLRVVEKRKRPRDQEEEIEKLRAQVELLRKQQSAEKGPEAQGETTRRGRGLEEDCKMEVEEEIDCKKKLDEWRKRMQKQLRDIEKFTDMEPMFWDSQKEKVEGSVTRD